MLKDFPSSFWRDVAKDDPTASVHQDITAEVAVVGAGIVGVVAALELAEQGKQVVLIEAARFGTGTTGYTTAKVSAQHGVIYAELIKTLGEEKARLYYDANIEALQFLEGQVESLGIDCDLERQHAYMYADSSSSAAKLLEKEDEAYATLGIDGGDATGEVNELLPYKVRKATVMHDQLQFHPVKYLQGLMKRFLELGGTFYEMTRVTGIEYGSPNRLTTEAGHTVSAKDVVVATHYPFNDFKGLYFSKMEVERSYVVSAEIPSAQFPEGMFISVDSPSRSLRHVKLDNGQKMAMFGGENHLSGHKKETFTCYENLGEFAHRHFGLESFTHHWSAQDLITLDKVPYIGRMTNDTPHVFVATGFSKWGMSQGIVAARVITDLIMQRRNRYDDLYDPSRSKWKLSDAARFVKTNADVAKEFIKGKVKRAEKTLDDLGFDEGAIIDHDGDHVAAYRDVDGNVTLVGSACTHMGCTVNWNQAERSWDCPCHGSRFKPNGEVIEGPAVKNLPRK
ncbi:FAD-dependent oxidoreductase [Exiguobacterium alkaliphilum]|uniref:FAD-dependent oxidoreductase n=1 Tax=Exiguobacterium alkaliphilum TaxID=1428684 RepID=UPI001BAB3AE2|nr:FAD-dependent oxidoreductase [Exiguobacterium alkaliphilum]QUE87167.1 FAD-dependent oxidoreductase [Exiguobacterium alkaliphilum]